MSALKSGQILEATPKGVCEDNKFSEDSNAADCYGSWPHVALLLHRTLPEMYNVAKVFSLG